MSDCCCCGDGSEVDNELLLLLVVDKGGDWRFRGPVKQGFRKGKWKF